MDTKLSTVECECGIEISLRGMVRHLKTKKNEHSEKYLDDTISLIKMGRIRRHGFLKKEGVDARLNAFWVMSVIKGETAVDDWSFSPPRPKGVMTMAARVKISKERSGNGNPALKNKPKYDIDEIKKEAKTIWGGVQKEDLRIRAFKRAMETRYPKFIWSFTELTNKNKERYRQVIQWLLDISDNEWLKIIRSDRGKKIKEGQNNPVTQEKMLKAIKKAQSRAVNKISRPQRKLFEIVKKFDPEAVLEYHVDYEKTWKSFDIFSPKINAFFEMHGRCWHDANSCKKGIRHIAEKNIQNDLIKKELSDKLGMSLYIFWDDQTDSWEFKIKQIYENKKNC